MAFKDRVYETSTSTGTGAFTMAGAVAGYQSFSAAFGTAAAYYLITNQSSSSQWEIGSFTVSGETLTRTAGNVLAGSSGAGTLVSFTAGTKNIYHVLPAAAMNAWLNAASGSVSVYGNIPSISSVSISVSGTSVVLSGTANCDCNCNCNCNCCCGGGGD